MSGPSAKIEALCRDYMVGVCAAHPDPSHDMLHVERVVALARWLGDREAGDLRVIVPAAYLHDCVYVSKADPRRSEASAISADKAVALLRGWGYDESLLPAIAHAIAAHSFSAGIPAESLEAKIVQDADRLDALGAIGAFRAFAYSGLASRPLYASEDPFCSLRAPDDRHNTLDHFYVKLLKLPGMLHTASARAEGQRRLKTMETLIEALRRELGPREIETPLRRARLH